MRNNLCTRANYFLAVQAVFINVSVSCDWIKRKNPTLFMERGQNFSGVPQ